MWRTPSAATLAAACRRCHKSDRYPNGVCRPCNRRRAAAKRTTDPEAYRRATKSWRDTNPGRARANIAAWRAAHPGWDLAWQRRHPEEMRVIRQRRRAREAAAEGALTAKEWFAILEYFGHRCAYCLRDDVELEMDHVIPLSHGGRHAAENIVPACKRDNSRKKDRPIFFMATV